MKQTFSTALLGLTLAVSGLAGCGKQNDGLSPTQEKMADRLDDIAKKSGGDWAKLSDADREYLVKDLSHGSEQSARMLLLAKSGKLKNGPGGPPGGQPGGPPARPGNGP